MADRPAPIVLEAPEKPSDPSKGTVMIFLHGLGDEGASWESTAREFQKDNRLPYMKWVLPTAPTNRDARERAWFYPTSLKPPPADRPELAVDEDEDGLLRSRKEVEGFIDDVVAQGYPVDRIVLGGFSQGCAMTLLTGFTSGKYAGKLAGLCALGGFLPLADRILELRGESGLAGVGGFRDMPVFFMRGGSDMLIPKRCLGTLREKVKEFGIKDELFESKEYPGVPHQVTPDVLMDVLLWLRRVVPPV